MSQDNSKKKIKIIRAATVPESLDTFCRGILKELSNEYEVVAVSSPGDALGRVAQREGVRTFAVPMERHISLMSDLKSLWKMWRVMRCERPVMVHSMTPKAGLICMLSAWLAGVPRRVHTFTGLVCTHKPIRVLGYGNVKGIDLEHYNPNAFDTSAHDGFTFVFVGRIVRDKGINELVSAFDRLRQEHCDVRLVLVGAGEDDLDPVALETKERIKRGDGIEAVGRQKDVRPFYAQADALVFPSYREGFPNVVIEAGAMNLPSIVTDINGSRDIIVDGKNGVIIPSQDEEALYEAMKRFVEHPDVVAQLAANARSMIASRFEQSYVRRCLYDFYHEIMNVNE